ncbi:MAG: homocysteine S-methyltransferase family protein [Pseudomonadota bacterium]
MTKTITLLDGGMGMELTRRSQAAHAVPLWSAQVMMDEPALVAAVHRDFLDAGAEVLLLNTYSATRRRLLRNGYGDITAELHAIAVRLANQALAASGRSARIAGCLPPLVMSYAVGDVPLYAEARAEFAELVALQAPHVDLMIAETMGTVAEGVAATEASVAAGLPTWCAFSVDDSDGTRLRSGEPLTAAFAAARAAGAEALLVNCSRPEAVSQGLAAVQATLPGLDARVGGYANGFVSIDALDASRSVDVLQARVDLDPAAYAEHVERWIALGATIVGGCCEVGPAHIAELARRLGKAHEATIPA